MFPYTFHSQKMKRKVLTSEYAYSTSKLVRKIFSFLLLKHFKLFVICQSGILLSFVHDVTPMPYNGGSL